MFLPSEEQSLMSVSLMARSSVMCLWSPYVYDIPYTLFYLNTSFGNHRPYLGLSLSITLYSVASDVGFQSYRAKLGLHDNLSQDACTNDSGFSVCTNPPLACIPLTLRPQLEELL